MSSPGAHRAGWFPSPEPSPRGTAVVLHGLNNAPRSLETLAAALNAGGFHAVCPDLHAAAAARERWPERRWLAAASAACAEAEANARGLPLYCVGYSLGALVALRFLQVQPGASFRRMVLLAPAVSLRPWARLWHSLFAGLPAPTPVPSLCLERFRARPYTPAGEYRAVQRLRGAVGFLGVPAARRCGAGKVIVDRRDELVSPDGIRGWLEGNALESWTLEEIRGERCSPRYPRHLLVAEETLGSAGWRRLSAAVVAHLRGEV